MIHFVQCIRCGQVFKLEKNEAGRIQKTDEQQFHMSGECVEGLGEER